MPPAASHHLSTDCSTSIGCHVVYLNLTLNCSICWVNIKPKYGFSAVFQSDGKVGFENYDVL